MMGLTLCCTQYPNSMNLTELIKKVFEVSFIKFLFVAGINTLFGLSIFYLTVFLLKNLYVSVVVATIIAVLFNFKTYGALVFKSKDNSRVFRFIGVYLCTMTIQMGLLKGLALVGIPNPYIAGAIILLPVSLLSFLLMRKFVFNATIEAENPNQP